MELTLEEYRILVHRLKTELRNEKELHRERLQAAIKLQKENNALKDKVILLTGRLLKIGRLCAEPTE